MIDLNENDVYKNDKITIWGKWWIPNGGNGGFLMIQII